MSLCLSPSSARLWPLTRPSPFCTPWPWLWPRWPAWPRPASADTQALYSRPAWLWWQPPLWEQLCGGSGDSWVPWPGSHSPHKHYWCHTEAFLCMQPVRTIFFLPCLWNNGSVHGYILYSTKMSELSQFFFSVLTCIDQWIVKYRGGKNPHSGCLFLKSSVTEYVTHNSRLISDSHELFLVCFPPFIFSPRWWSNCWETLTESQFSSVLLIELWRVADCSVTCFCEHWHSAALRCPWRPVLMVHFDTWPCCEASECFFGFFFFLFVVLFSLSRFCTECDFSATFVSELMMSHCGWIKSSINQIYTLFLC